jgi:hypothetical protein
MVVNNVVGLAKTVKAFGIPTILTTVVEERGGYLIQGLQDVFPDQKPINRTFINTWEDSRVVDAPSASTTDPSTRSPHPRPSSPASRPEPPASAASSPRRREHRRHEHHDRDPGAGKVGTVLERFPGSPRGRTVARARSAGSDQAAWGTTA